MLKNIIIKNFTIIEDMSIDFNSGFSVITGETGSGKSVIIEALNLILGSRANNKVIKDGCDKSYLTARFLISDKIKNYLDTLDIDHDDEIELQRVLNVNGKSTFKLNGQIVPLNVINSVRDYLIEIKSQSDNIISDNSLILSIVDSFGNIRSSEVFEKYLVNYSEYLELNKKLSELSNFSLVNIEDIKVKLAEIDRLNVYDGEYEELVNKANYNRNLVEINSIVDDITKNLESLSDTSYTISKAIDKLNNFGFSYDSYKDIDVLIQDFRNSFSVDVSDITVAELNYIEERIYDINLLFNKYGGSYESMKSEYDQLNELIYNIENNELLIVKTKESIAIKEAELLSYANVINECRYESAKLICNDINALLNDMYMESDKVDISFEIVDFNEYGNTLCSLNISTNGQKFHNINAIASGGEKARVQLAIKYITAINNNLSTIIFDEIDTGVSGRVAKSMGTVMKNLGKYCQVIAITHLPQVASQCMHHLVVSKDSTNDGVVSEINYVTGESRVNAIAMMLSGHNISKEAVDNAKILIEEANDEI